MHILSTLNARFVTKVTTLDCTEDIHVKNMSNRDSWEYQIHCLFVVSSAVILKD